MSTPNRSQPQDIWSADAYGKKVAPFVATLTDKIVSWLDPEPEGTATMSPLDQLSY